MNLLNKYLLMLVLFSSISFPQEYLKEQFEFAKKVFDNEDYYDAVTEFKRLQFFDKNETYSFESNKFIALSYKEGGKYDEAVRYFTLAEINAADSEETFNIKIEIVKANILRRTTDNALKLLSNLENDERWKNKIDEINYWRGWAFIFSDEWDKASYEFAKISENHELKILCEKTDDEKYSVVFAKIASVILPGTGQFYTGNYLSGLLSFGWCALWGYIAVDAFVEDRIFDGLAVANFLWFRFYNGNLQNAEKFAIEENIKISNQALDYLQNKYTGVKP